ncbi:hypothetical protein N6H18_10860 [Reichenbachiella agarivorans]|uniref:Glycosyltransferase 2-like domain-containing protein n=1 Tax=Reichenbachiella agarivorans TaxID=2979464 RepID=A0ABY6CNC5_9BACT|nr:glycosyltransferase family 2 protein [Reichenbachiella agarivorans]UXP30853.1 hypothetical protein N6H18_10860 [Reichenbachiella agarivorans]
MAGFRIYLTAWGNNMSVTQATLKAIDYNTIKESVIEDVALLNTIKSHGGSLYVNTDLGAVLTTQPEKSLFDIVSQRMRWAKGMMFVSNWVKIALILKIMYLPAVCLLMHYHPIVVCFFLMKVVCQLILILKIRRELRAKISVIWICFFDWYEFLVYFSSFVAHVLSLRFRWKGRNYR